MLSLEKFSELHQAQLNSVGLPQNLWRKLYDKLTPSEVVDAGEKFHIDVSNGAQLIVQDEQQLAANADVFLSKHVFFSDGNVEAVQKLENCSPMQLNRLENILCSPPAVLPVSAGTDATSCVQFAQLSGLSESDASKLLTESKYDVINAAWRHWDPNAPQPKPATSGVESIPNELRDISFEEFKASLDDEDRPSDEASLQRLYKEFCKKRKASHEHDRGDVEHVTTKYIWTQENEDHPGSGDEGTVTVRIPVPKSTKKTDVVSTLTTSHWKFIIKGSEMMFDGDLFAPCVPDESYWTLGKGEESGTVTMTLQKRDPRLAWEHVVAGEVALSDRLLSQLDLKKEEEEEQRKARASRLHHLLERTWLYGQTYQAVTREGKQRPVWYIMDMYASALQHSDKPNFRCAPFVFAVNGQPYSIYWPVKDVKGGEVCTRNYISSILDVESQLQHDARLWVWTSVKDSSLAMGKCPDQFLEALHKMREKDSATAAEKRTDLPDDDDDSKASFEIEAAARSKLVDGCISVYVDKQASSLPWSSCSLCRVVSKPNDAQWLWLGYKLSQWAERMTPAHRLNRLDGEECLIDRSLLSYMLRSAGHSSSPWFVPMYDVHRQLAQVMASHWDRGVACHWLLLPARSDVSIGLKTVLSRDVRRVSRLAESIPSVAIPYTPLTDQIDDRRYLLHYVVGVCAVSPLAAFVSLRPLVRCAAEKASENDWFDEYSTLQGFALPDWSDKDGGANMSYKDFSSKFNAQHKESGVTFDVIQYSIVHCIRDVLRCATDLLKPFPGSSQNPIAMYGIDFVIAQSQLQPLLLGATANPRFGAVDSFDSMIRVMAATKPATACEQYDDIVQIL